MRTAKEYLRLLQSLLPKGKAWNRDDDSTLYEFLYGQAEEFVRVDARSSDLLVERNTLYTNELLTDHENDLGLPDECSNEDETIQERRNNAHSKLIQLGQQNPQYFIDIAAAIGWTITITEFSPFICGVNSSGDSCGDSDVIFYWLVTVDLSSANTVYFTSGNSQSGDSLQQIVDIDYLLCKLNQLKPAHTKIIYEYEGPEFSEAFSSAFDSLPSGSESHLTGAFNQSFGLGYDVYLGGDFDSGAFDAGFLQPGYGTDISMPINYKVNLTNTSITTAITQTITRQLYANITNLPSVSSPTIFIDGLIQFLVNLENTSLTTDIDKSEIIDLLVNLTNTSLATDTDKSIAVNLLTNLTNTSLTTGIDKSEIIDILVSLANTSLTTDINESRQKDLIVNLVNSSLTTDANGLKDIDLLVGLANTSLTTNIDPSVVIDLLASIANSSLATDIDKSVALNMLISLANTSLTTGIDSSAIRDLSVDVSNSSLTTDINLSAIRDLLIALTNTSLTTDINQIKIRPLLANITNLPNATTADIEVQINLINDLANTSLTTGVDVSELTINDWVDDENNNWVDDNNNNWKDS